jgi:hypothetical protein
MGGKMKYKPLLNVFLAALILSFGAASALAYPASYTIPDPDGLTSAASVYWGGVYNVSFTNMDVLGAPEFSLDGIVARISPATADVWVYGDYFRYLGGVLGPNDSPRPWYMSLYGPGDLFIDTGGWSTMSNSPHYPTDYFDIKGEGWDYVVTGQGVYGLSSSTDYVATHLDSSMTGGGYVYRTRQAWIKAASNTAKVDDAALTTDYTNGWIHYQFDTSALGLKPGDQVGLHWTQMCGNDIIEGNVTVVPEPGTLLLLGAGMIGLGLVRRKVKGAR